MRDSEEIHECCCGGIRDDGEGSIRGELVHGGEAESGKAGCEDLSAGGPWGEGAGAEGSWSWCYYAVLECGCSG